jgi:predicted transcriptional regulator
MSKLSRLKDTTQWYSNVQSMITLFEIEKLIKTEKQGRIKKTYLTGKGEKLKYNLNELKNEMIKLNIWK